MTAFLLHKIITNFAKHPFKTVAIILAPELILLALVYVILVILLGGSVADNNQCDSSSGGTYSANFSIKDVGPGSSNVSEPLEKWCASQGLNAAQTAGVLASAMKESTMGTAHNGGGKYGDFMGAGATTADTSHNGDSVPDYMNWFVHKFSSPWSAPGAWDKYKKMKNSSPYDLGYFWGAHLDVAAAHDYSTRGNFAKQIYAKIAHGSSQVTVAADTSDSNNSCGGGDDSDTTDIIAYGKRFLGLGYSQGTHAKGAEDIAKGGTRHSVAETDCSGFVWGVLKHCGYKVSSTPWTVGSGCEENTFKGLHHVSASDTHAGTVVMADEKPHTAILMEKWHGNKTKVLEEGGYGGNCNIETYGEAFDEPVSIFANPEKA